MRYAILSDVHGNLEALRAVLADSRDEADVLLCLGDVVGYGADPGPCVDLLAARAAALVAGNHEHGVAGLLSLDWFNAHARAAAVGTRPRLGADARAYLGALPLTSQVGDATLVHASPARPEEWDYLVTRDEGLEAFRDFETRLCFVGHSHRPGHWSMGSSGGDYHPGTGDVVIEHGRRYLVNVGSVGQPRDRDPRASYAVWDAEAGRVTFRRVGYDVAVTRHKIVAAGLPRFLADRLALGA
jgi:diadenosine tetraphosphatase ApaH/serine/threonine PP2A family protein phosphatase